jgi:putative salt-induced outer membrane protein
MKKAILMTGLLLASAGHVYADDEATEKNQWSGSGYLGLTSTSGNSDTESLTAGLKIKYETGKWINAASLDLLKASADNVDTAERLIFSTKTGYKFDDNDYIYYGSRYENDNFSAFDYTMSTGMGWGHKFFDDDNSRLITEIGGGYKIEALDIDRTENTGVAFLSKLDYMRKFSDTVMFENVTIIESTSDNNFIQNDAGLSFKVSDKFAVKLVHQLRHNTDVPVGIDKTDTLVSANLVYDF